jgi:hypothetical protein
VTKERTRFQKILAVAVNPGALEGEAMAALQRARELVKRNPELAHPPPPPTPAVNKPQTEPEASYTGTIRHIHPDWLLIVVDLLSKRGHALGLKYRIGFDFTQSPFGLQLEYEGSQRACEGFAWSLNWVVSYINEQPRPGQ